MEGDGRGMVEWLNIPIPVATMKRLEKAARRSRVSNRLLAANAVAYFLGDLEKVQRRVSNQ